MPRLLLPLFFLLLPLAEIAGFILVGRRIGVWPTLGLVVLSAVAGVVLIRVQGFGALARLRQAAAGGDEPGRALLDTAMIVLAGFLLLIPGFLTDIIGLLLFLPPFRRWLWNRIRRNFVVVDISAGPRRSPPDDGPQRTIELGEDEFRRDERDGGRGL
ncbi:FxsA family protein [Shinella pollutisoli]|uniref:FxsA family protein n=1 Tax=Shinella pollutisoli TaxID=2250594 RepID=A0ABV7DG51_9HYPH|nr:FxsA family protein [Shinella pollutisoli]